MSKSSATDQHGNWRTVPEVQIKDAIRERAEEAFKLAMVGRQYGEEETADAQAWFWRGYSAALAEKEADIAELVESCIEPNHQTRQGNWDGRRCRVCQFAWMDADGPHHGDGCPIPKHAKPKGTT